MTTNKMREEWQALKSQERHANAAESRYWCEQYKQFAERLLEDATRRALPDGFVPVPVGDAKNAKRYKWLVDRVLACDYGDNDAPGEQIGWRIRRDLLPANDGRQPAFMYGASPNAAIDAAMLQAAPRGSRLYPAFQALKDAGVTCSYPACNCPFDANECARGLDKAAPRGE